MFPAGDPWKTDNALNHSSRRGLYQERLTRRPLMTDTKSKPAPLETEPGKQADDNIDDLGRKQDGSKQEQPGTVKPSKPNRR
jgi:hypothetical protein